MSKLLCYLKINLNTETLKDEVSEVSLRDQNCFLLCCSIVNSVVKLSILTRESVGIDSLLEPASCGQMRYCSFWHFGVLFYFAVLVVVFLTPWSFH